MTVGCLMAFAEHHLRNTLLELRAHLLEECLQRNPGTNLSVVDVLHEPKHFYGLQLIHKRWCRTKSISSFIENLMKCIARLRSSSKQSSLRWWNISKANRNSISGSLSSTRFRLIKSYPKMFCRSATLSKLSLSWSNSRNHFSVSSGSAHTLFLLRST
jgi:hypothetical protein